MKTKIQIHVEYVQRLKREIDAINKLSLDDIEIFRGGDQVEISDEEKEEWKYIGLSTFTFLSDL